MPTADWLAARLRIKKQDILEIALRGWVREELRKLGLPEGAVSPGLSQAEARKKDI